MTDPTEHESPQGDDEVTRLRDALRVERAIRMQVQEERDELDALLNEKAVDIAKRLDEASERRAASDQRLDGLEAQLREMLTWQVVPKELHDDVCAERDSLRTSFGEAVATLAKHQVAERSREKLLNALSREVGVVKLQLSDSALIARLDKVILKLTTEEEWKVK
jgi:hypothetical protein